MKLFCVTLEKEVELVVLATDSREADKVALDHYQEADEFALDWHPSSSYEITSKNKHYVGDWLNESPCSDLSGDQLEKYFGEGYYDPTVQEILDLVENKEKERLAAEAAERLQVKLPF